MEEFVHSLTNGLCGGACHAKGCYLALIEPLLNRSIMTQLNTSLIVPFLTLCSLAGYGQTPCDPDPAMLNRSVPSDHTMDTVSVAFNTIFGPDYYAWQLCGDTVMVGTSTVIYSYPECRIWMHNAKGLLKWSTDLSVQGGCRLMSIHPIPDEELPRHVRKYNTLIQFDDKRIFILAKRTGRMKHLTLDEFDIFMKQAKDPQCRPRKRAC